MAMTRQLFAIGMALGLALAASPASARKDIETQGPSLNGTMFEGADAADTGFKVEAVELPRGTALTSRDRVVARRDGDMQGPTLNGTVFQVSNSYARGFRIEAVELPDGSPLGR